MMMSFPDPRPQVAADGAAIEGWCCTQCRWPLALSGPWCPRCRGALEAVTFGPQGTVWSATVLRVPLPGRPGPSMLAYVDLDDGPRVLAHVLADNDDRLHAGDRVALSGSSEEGDLTVRRSAQ